MPKTAQRRRTCPAPRCSSYPTHTTRPAPTSFPENPSTDLFAIVFGLLILGFGFAGLITAITHTPWGLLALGPAAVTSLVGFWILRTEVKSALRPRRAPRG